MKYIKYSLAIFFLAVVLLACSTTSTQLPSPSPSATFFIYPTSTAIPAPTKTTAESVTNLISGKIAFVTLGIGEDGRIQSKIIVFDIEKNEAETIFKVTGGTMLFSPVWSPRGDEIAFIASDTQTRKESIYLVNLKTKEQKIIEVHAAVSSLSWSSDSSTLVFAKNSNGQKEIFLLEIESSLIRQATPKSLTGDFPSWSPLGNQIAHLTFDAPSYGEGAHIYSFNFADQSSRRLSDFIAGPNSKPAWSPDGTKLAFRSNGGCGDLYILNTNTGQVNQITHMPGGEKDPAWSPDGSFLIFAASNFACDLSSGGEPLYQGWQPYLVSINEPNPTPLEFSLDEQDVFGFDWYSNP